MPSLLDFFETRRPAAKRRKLSPEESIDPPTLPRSGDVDEVAPPEFKKLTKSRSQTGSADAVDLSVGNEDVDIPKSSQTELEVSLPAIKIDQDAIAEYENSRTAEGGEEDEEELSLQQRLGEMKWRKGKSSIYVDAFNLALETVLNEEAHLFNETELEVFRKWDDLSYEAQYLFVALQIPRLILARNEQTINSWFLIFIDMYDSSSARQPPGTV